MSLVNFWEYVIENGWRMSYFPEDDDGNYECPFCNYTITRKVDLDAVPTHEKVIYCPRCGEIESEGEEI